MKKKTFIVGLILIMLTIFILTVKNEELNTIAYMHHHDRSIFGMFDAREAFLLQS